VKISLPADIRISIWRSLRGEVLPALFGGHCEVVGEFERENLIVTIKLSKMFDRLEVCWSGTAINQS
jgi:hypothetical protein